MRVVPVVQIQRAVSNITIIRRSSVLALFQTYAEHALAAGAPPKGLEQAFAATLEISPSMWSQIKSSRPISDKLARQIESHAGKAPGWLDEERQDAPATPAEKAFMELALAAFRATNSAGRKSLRQHLLKIAEPEISGQSDRPAPPAADTNAAGRPDRRPPKRPSTHRLA